MVLVLASLRVTGALMDDPALAPIRKVLVAPERLAVKVPNPLMSKILREAANVGAV